MSEGGNEKRKGGGREGGQQTNSEDSSCWLDNSRLLTADGTLHPHAICLFFVCHYRIAKSDCQEMRVMRVKIKWVEDWLRIG